MVDVESPDACGDFLFGVRDSLERALTARFGVDVGLDAAADAVEYAVRHWKRLHGMQNPAGYLYRVGQSSGRRRLLGRERAQLLVAEPATVDEPIDVDLQRALLRLSPPQRVAIVLVHAHGFSYQEAAKQMDLKVTTLTNHLSRGLRRLRRTMEIEL